MHCLLNLLVKLCGRKFGEHKCAWLICSISNVLFLVKLHHSKHNYVWHFFYNAALVNFHLYPIYIMKIFSTEVAPQNGLLFALPSLLLKIYSLDTLSFFCKVIHLGVFKYTHTRKICPHFPCSWPTRLGLVTGMAYLYPFSLDRYRYR